MRPSPSTATTASLLLFSAAVRRFRSRDADATDSSTLSAMRLKASASPTRPPARRPPLPVAKPASSSSSPLEPVSQAAHSDQPCGLRRLLLDLLAQPAHVHVHRPRVPGEAA